MFSFPGELIRTSKTHSVTFMKEFIDFCTLHFPVFYAGISMLVIALSVSFSVRLYFYKAKLNREKKVNEIYDEAYKDKDFLDAIAYLNIEFPTSEEILLKPENKRTFFETVFPVDNIPFALGSILAPYILLLPILMMILLSKLPPPFMLEQPKVDKVPPTSIDHAIQEITLTVTGVLPRDVANILKSKFIRTILSIIFVGSSISYALNKDNENLKRYAISVCVSSTILISFSIIISQIK